MHACFIALEKIGVMYNFTNLGWCIQVHARLLSYVHVQNSTFAYHCDFGACFTRLAGIYDECGYSTCELVKAYHTDNGQLGPMQGEHCVKVG
jgi:hypothetical protein